MMRYRLLKDEKLKLLQYMLIVFFVLSAIYMSVSFLIQSKADSIKKDNILNTEQVLVDVEKAMVSSRINGLVTDLLYLSDSLRLSNYDSGDYSDIEQDWLSFSNRKRIYDQIRFIDLDGNEVIRVNYHETGAVVVDDDSLQNKKDRYYFTDTISLAENQIYISQMDLNVENSMIEQPIKPMIRLSMPFYSSSGDLKGIVVINYIANELLEQIVRLSSANLGNLFMLNSLGYWLYNSSDNEKAWAFMYEDKADVSFSNAFPNEWSTIIKTESGKLIQRDGVFTYTSILTNSDFTLEDSRYSLVLGYGDCYLVSYISPDSQEGLLFSSNALETALLNIKQNLYVYFLISFISVFVALIFTINRVNTNRIKYFSQYDTMTGVYNRRAGFEKLTEIYKALSKKTCSISICFLDINGLKEVNDHLGHEAGDELILSVVNGIKLNIRENDFISRLGGDEFLIIFEGVDELYAENIWARIVKEYERINSQENRKYVVSVSHGIETLTCKSNEYIDSTINHADEKMYLEKRLIKKDLKVIRDN